MGEPIWKTCYPYIHHEMNQFGEVRSKPRTIIVVKDGHLNLSKKIKRKVLVYNAKTNRVSLKHPINGIISAFTRDQIINFWINNP